MNFKFYSWLLLFRAKNIQKQRNFINIDAIRRSNDVVSHLHKVDTIRNMCENRVSGIFWDIIIVSCYLLTKRLNYYLQKQRLSLSANKVIQPILYPTNYLFIYNLGSHYSVSVH